MNVTGEHMKHERTVQGMKHVVFPPWWWWRIHPRFSPISDHCPMSIWPHDALGTSNMHKLLYFCSSWFLVRTCSLNEASCCCCSSGLVSMPGMLEICSRASWILVLSLFSSWWMSWLSLSMLGAKTTNTKTQKVMTYYVICYQQPNNKRIHLEMRVLCEMTERGSLLGKPHIFETRIYNASDLASYHLIISWTKGSKEQSSLSFSCFVWTTAITSLNEAHVICVINIRRIHRKRVTCSPLAVLPWGFRIRDWWINCLNLVILQCSQLVDVVEERSIN